MVGCTGCSAYKLFPISMKKPPFVSVIIPTYNRGHCIISAIESVQSQVYSNYEIIVVDDGSVDDTKCILSEHIRNCHITYIYQENKGVSAARNAGLRVAKGEWIAFLDSDDRWLPEKLLRQIEIIHQSTIELGCVICNMEFSPIKNKISTSFEDSLFLPNKPQGVCTNMTSILLTRFIMFNQGAIIKTSLLAKLGGFDEHLKILEDYDLALRLSFVCNFGYESIPLVIYQRDTASSLSSNVQKIDETSQVLKVLKGIRLFLDDQSIPVPSLLNRQIVYNGLLLRLLSIPNLSFAVRAIKALYRRSSFFPNPVCKKIICNRSQG